jgi:hypothetical protein
MTEQQFNNLMAALMFFVNAVIIGYVGAGWLL